MTVSHVLAGPIQLGYADHKLAKYDRSDAKCASAGDEHDAFVRPISILFVLDPFRASQSQAIECFSVT